MRPPASDDSRGRRTLLPQVRPPASDGPQRTATSCGPQRPAAHTTPSAFRLIDKLAKRLEQVVEVDGLAQMRIHPRLQGALHILVEGVGRQRNNGNRLGVWPIERSNGLRRLQAVHLGHLAIHKHQVIGLLLGMLNLQHMQSLLAPAQVSA